MKTSETNITDIVRRPNSKENIKSVPEDRKAPVKKETVSNLSKEPTNLFLSKNLKNIGVSVGEAKILCMKILGVEKLKLPGTKDSIKEFQRKNNLRPIDGIVGKDTYNKMLEIDNKSNVLIVEMEKKLKSKQGLDLTTLNKIADLLPKMLLKSKNYQKICLLYSDFKNNSKYKDKISNPEYNKLILKIDGIFLENETIVENSEEAQSIYAILNDKNLSWSEKIKKIATNPTLLMTGGILFLSGVIGGNSEYTNSFFKRLGWLFGGMLLGPKLCETIGCAEMFDDFNKSSKNGVVHDAGEAASKTSKEVSEWIITSAKNAWEVINDTFDTGSQKTNEFFKGLNFDDFKPSFLSVAGGIESKNKTLDKTKQISEESLKNLSGVLLSDKKFLLTTKGDLLKITKSNLKEYLIPQSFSKLTDKDKENIEKYINLLKQEFDTDEIFVRDLFITKEVLDKIMSSLGDSYIQNLDLPVTTKQDLLTLLNSPYKKDKIIAIDIISAFESKDPKKLDEIISVYGSNAKVANLNLNKVIDSIKNYLHDKEELEKLKTYLKETLETKGVETKTTLEEKLKLLDTYTDPFVLPEFKKKFEELKAQKKLEIFKKAQSLGVVELNGENVDNYLQNLEAQIQQAEQQKYEEQKQEFDKEFSTIIVPSITESKIDIPKYKDYNQKIQKDYNKLNSLNTNNYFTNSWNNFAEFINSFANKNLVEKRSLSKIDKYKAGIIKTVLLELKKAQFDLEDKFDTSLIGLSISDIQEKWETVRGFKNEELKNKKQEELKVNLLKIIGGISDKDSLEQYKNLCDIFKLDDEYKEKEKEKGLKRMEKENKTAGELERKLEDWGVGSFFDKYKTIRMIKDIDDNFGGNTKLIEIKRALENIKKTFENDTSKKQMIEELNKILEKINIYLNN